MNETALIRLTSLPVIEEQLRTLKESWEQKAKDAEAMVCTEDTVQDIKKARAEMRKEFDAAEAQRKAVKAQYMAPWTRVEAVYKECVEDAYNRADTAYKAKVSKVEDVQKAECEKKCRDYFAELCAVHGVEWLRYEQAGLKISLTEAKKKTPSGMFDKISMFVAGVADDVCAIDLLHGDVRDAVMAEFKKTLNRSRAMIDVKKRIDAEAEERKAAEERAERQKREAEAVAKVEAAASVVAPPVAAEAPKEEKLLTVTFRATGTRVQLIKVREFMKQEGISYE